MAVRSNNGVNTPHEGVVNIFSRLLYLRALELLILKAEEIGFNIRPTEVVTDFEIALIQAIQLAFPLTKVRSCFFFSFYTGHK